MLALAENPTQLLTTHTLINRLGSRIRELENALFIPNGSVSSEMPGSEGVFPSFKGKFIDDIEKLKDVLFSTSRNSRIFKKATATTGNLSDQLSLFIKNNLNSLESEILSVKAIAKIDENIKIQVTEAFNRSFQEISEALEHISFNSQKNEAEQPGSEIQTERNFELIGSIENELKLFELKTSNAVQEAESIFKSYCKEARAVAANLEKAKLSVSALASRNRIVKDEAGMAQVKSEYTTLQQFLDEALNLDSNRSKNVEKLVQNTVSFSAQCNDFVKGLTLNLHFKQKTKEEPKNELSAMRDKIASRKPNSAQHSRAGSELHARVSEFNLDKVLAADPHRLLQDCRKEREALKAEKETVLNKYEGKLSELHALIGSLLHSVDRLLRNMTCKSVDESYAVTMLERDRKMLADALDMPAFRGVATQSSSKQISASSSLQKLKNQFEIKALVQKQIQNTQLNRPSTSHSNQGMNRLLHTVFNDYSSPKNSRSTAQLEGSTYTRSPQHTGSPLHGGSFLLSGKSISGFSLTEGPEVSPGHTRTSLLEKAILESSIEKKLSTHNKYGGKDNLHHKNLSLDSRSILSPKKTLESPTMDKRNFQALSQLNGKLKEKRQSLYQQIGLPGRYDNLIASLKNPPYTKMFHEEKPYELNPNSLLSQNGVELDQKIIALREENMKLLEELNASTQREIELKQKCTGLEKLIDDLQREIGLLSQNREETCGNILQIEHEFEAFRATHAELQEEFREKCTELQNCEKEVRFLSSQNAELAKKAQNAQQEMIRVRTLNEQYIQKKESLAIQIHALQEEIKEKARSISAVEKERDSLLNQVSTLSKKAQTLESQSDSVKQIQEQLQKSNAEMTESQHSVSELKKALTEANLKYQSAVLANQELRSQTEVEKIKYKQISEETHQKELMALRKELKELKSKNTYYEHEIQELRSQMKREKTRFEKEIEDLHQNEHRLRCEIEEFINNTQMLETEVQNLRIELESQRQLANALDEEERNRVYIELQAMTEKFEMANNTIKDLQKLLSVQKEHQQMIAQLEEANANAYNEIEKLETELQLTRESYEKLVSGLRDEITQLESRASGLEELNSQYKEKMGQHEERFQDYINASEQRVSAHQQENAELKEELEGISSQNHELKQKIANLIAEANIEKSQNECFKSDESNWKEQLEYEREEKMRLERQNQDFSNKIESLEENLKQTEARCEKYQAEIMTLEGMNSDLNNEIMKLSKRQLASADTTNDSEAGVEKQLREEIAKLHSEKDDLIEDIKMFKVMLTDKDDHLTQKIEECRNNFEKIKSLESNVEVYKKRVSKLIDENESQVEQITKIKSEKTTLQERYTKAEQEKEALASSYDKLEAKTQDLYQKNDELTEKIKGLTMEIEKLKTTAEQETTREKIEGDDPESRTKDSEQVTNEESPSTTERKTLLHDLEMVRQQLATLTEEYETMRSENEKLAAAARDDAKLHQEEIVKNKKRIEELEEEALKLQKEIEGKESELCANREKINQLQSELERESQTLETQKSELEKTINDLQQENKELKSKVAQQISELATVTCQKEELESQLASDHESYMEKLSELNSQLQELETRLLTRETEGSKQSGTDNHQIAMKLRDLQAQYEQKVLSNNKLQSEVDDLRKQVLQSNQQLTELVSQHSDLKLQNAQQAEQSAQLKEELLLKNKKLEECLKQVSELKKELEELTDIKIQSPDPLGANTPKLDALLEGERIRYAKLEEHVRSNLLELLRESGKSKGDSQFSNDTAGKDLDSLISELKRVFVELLAAQNSEVRVSKEREYTQEIARLKGVIDNMGLEMIKYDDELKQYEHEQLLIEEIFKIAKKTKALLQPIDQNHLIENLSSNSRMKPLTENPEFIKNALLYHNFLCEIVSSLPNAEFPDTLTHHPNQNNLEKPTNVSSEEKKQEAPNEEQNFLIALLTKIDEKLTIFLERIGNHTERSPGLPREDASLSATSLSEKIETKLQDLEKLIEGLPRGISVREKGHKGSENVFHNSNATIEFTLRDSNKRNAAYGLEIPSDRRDKKIAEEEMSLKSDDGIDKNRVNSFMEGSDSEDVKSGDGSGAQELFMAIDKTDPNSLAEALRVAYEEIEKLQDENRKLKHVYEQERFINDQISAQLQGYLNTLQQSKTQNTELKKQLADVTAQLQAQLDFTIEKQHIRNMLDRFLDCLFENNKEAFNFLKTLMSILLYSEQDKVAFFEKLKTKGKKSAFAKMI